VDDHQTPLFRAAFLGAPVANMTSAYGGIRWRAAWRGRSSTRSGQSRIGKTPVGRACSATVENSPLFYWTA
jgi:hypothetical protein